MNEVWRNIDNYEASNTGMVRNLITGQVLRPWKNRDGYLLVTLCKDGVRKHCLVHRLVAQAFISNPNNYPEVNHKDEDKLNNRFDNLEWCPHKYNINYGTRNERVSKKVYQYSMDGKLCGLWPSTMECGRYGFNQGAIAACCRGERTKHKGFKWSYEPPKPLLALPYYPLAI